MVDTRNEMAHASGRFEILTDDGFETKVSSVLNSMAVIHDRMKNLIRKWYEEVLLSYCLGEYEGYDDPQDFIAEQMIQSFKLSVKEMIVCKDMSISQLITAHRGYEKKLKDFKKAVTDYCKEWLYT
ncbi:MAG: hypothetical protein LUF29_06710 [Oscillospiraceae bacterium]|nr:hypothetical protein [Oscillospiraceae bacterium]